LHREKRDPFYVMRQCKFASMTQPTTRPPMQTIPAPAAGAVEQPTTGSNHANKARETAARTAIAAQAAAVISLYPNPRRARAK